MSGNIKYNEGKQDKERELWSSASTLPACGNLPGRFGKHWCPDPCLKTRGLKPSGWALAVIFSNVQPRWDHQVREWEQGPSPDGLVREGLSVWAEMRLDERPSCGYLGKLCCQHPAPHLALRRREGVNRWMNRLHQYIGWCQRSLSGED